MPREYSPAFVARFWAKVDKNGPTPTHMPHLGPCWLWTAACIGGGYGEIAFEGRPLGAHRVSWEIGRGEILDGLWVLHKCDNPQCVNPAHLFLGTVKDNAQDAIGKGRLRFPSRLGRRGESNPLSKLTADDVLSIRVRCSRRATPVAVIAKEYGLHPQTVAQILRGDRWGWLEDGLALHSPPHRLTDEEKAAVVRLAREGHSTRAIAQQFGIHSATVNRIRRRYYSGGG